MDGVHDMGGMHGFGPVPYEAGEPVFHHEWERRMWGLMFATTPPEGTNLDVIRHGLERIPPDLYLRFSQNKRKKQQKKKKKKGEKSGSRYRRQPVIVRFLSD
eukprot:TRINITY_DN40102_c2_g1_i1.p3 TRINITY_DN40102_c2_g1~~TRINITY_DN40102_c2_g1_i1.p3  ORF type:complete len:102 (+),score=20.73 TRINITY_DN40102_c2_g1_i1:12-317(+)